MADLTVQSALNSPLHAMQLLVLLEKAEYSSIVEYLIQFNIAAQQANLTVLPNDVIRDALLALFLGRLKPHFTHFPPELWGEWFVDYLPLLLPGINETQLSWLVTNISCSSYQSVVKGLNKAFVNMPRSTKVNVYNIYIKPFLNKKALEAGVCKFTSYMQWTRDNLGSFINQATIQDLIEYNVNFSKVKGNITLTIQELADFTLISDGLCDKSLSQIIFSKVRLLESYEDINQYLEFVQKNLRPIPYSTSNIVWCDDHKVLDQLSVQTQQYLLSSVLFLLNKEWSLNDMPEWIQVFKALLKDFTVALNETHISNLPRNISCENYQAIMELLNRVYLELSDSDGESAYVYGKMYLTEQLESTGSTCTFNANNSKEWITINFGAFVTKANISDLLILYPNLNISVLFGMLTPEEMAELLIKEDVLNNYLLFTKILSLVELRSITEYVNAITLKATEASLPNVTIAAVKETLLALTLQKLSSNFFSYQAQDWTVLFQKYLVLLLPNFNSTLLELLPANISCLSYQEVVKGFDNIYALLPKVTKADFYNYFIKRYMSEHSSDIVCDANDFRTWINLNFGNFITESSSNELVLFNKNLTKMENPNELSAVELSDFTFAADALGNTTLSRILLNQIKEFRDYDTLLEYLISIKSSICQTINPSSNILSCNKLKPLSQLSVGTQQELLTNVLMVLNERWSLLNVSKWLQVFDILLVNFFEVLNERHFSQLPLTISCEHYQPIIKKLSDVYPKLTYNETAAIYTYSKLYLTQQKNITGSACANNINNTKEWINLNVGSFSTSATISVLIDLFPSIDMGVLLYLLTPTDAAVLLIKPDVLSNSTLLEYILNFLQPQEISLYVSTIVNVASEANISLSQINMVKETLLGSVLVKINANISRYEAEDWRLLFQQYLVMLLPAFNRPLLHLLPTNIPCSSYQAIVKGFSMLYESLSNQTRDIIYQDYIKKYLVEQSQSKGIACDDNNLRTWIEVNIGRFLPQTFMQDLIQFNYKFGKVETPALFTAAELADVTFLAEFLQNTTLIDALLNQIKYFEDCTVLLGYLFRIQSTICQSQQSLCNKPQEMAWFSVKTQKTLASNIFALLAKEWTCINGSTWLQILNIILNSFSVLPNQVQISQLPLNVSCQDYQAIIQELNRTYDRFSSLERESIFMYGKSFLTLQTMLTGSPCAADINDSKVWLQKNWGLFYTSGTVSELIKIYPSFDIALVLELLKPSDVTLLLTYPKVLLNQVVLRSIFSQVETQNITEYEKIITETAEKGNISLDNLTKIKQTLLSVTLGKLSPSLASYQTQDWKILLQTELAVLLPYFNTTHLQLLPTNITCSSYQEILKGFMSIYVRLSADTKQNIFNHFIRIYLKKEASSKGSACVSGTSSENEWLKLNLDEFYIFVTLTEIVSFYPGFVVSDLQPNVTASILIQKDVLQNSTLLSSILGSIDPRNITKYVKAITSVSKEANMSVENLATLNAVLLNVTLEKLNLTFSSYQTQDWVNLFQYELVVLLPYFKTAHLKLLPINIGCSSYQAIVKGFSLVYKTLPEDTKEDIFNYFIKRFLNNQASSQACVHGTTSNDEWITLNLAEFYIFTTLAELKVFNPAFDLSGLSPSIAASMLVKENILLNTTLLTSFIRGIDPENITEYVKAISSAAIQANMSVDNLSTISTILLDVTLQTLNSTFGSYQTQDWTYLFQNELVVLLPFFNTVHLKFLPISISCSSYQAIIKGLSLSFKKLSENTKEDIFNYFIKRYLNIQATSQGSACASSTSSKDEWITLNLAEFYMFATLSELKAFYPEFDLDGISANATASIIIKDDVLQNTTLLMSILRGIELQNITEYVEAITSAATQANMSIEKIDTVKEILLTVTLEKLSSNFVSYQTQDWAVLFQKQLVVLLPYFNVADLQLLPTNITCSSYQEILKGFTLNYESLSADTKQDIFNHFIKIYLTKKGPSNGSSCVSQTSSQTEWIKLYLDKFYVFATLTELVAFYPGFVVDGISANATASIIIKDDVLQNTTLLTSILRGIELQNITEYVEVITAAATQANMSIEKIDTLKEILLTVTLEKLSSNFVSYQTQDWAVLFQKQLVVLLPYFNVADLQLLPTNITCSSYQEIVKGFTLNYESLSADTKQDIFNHFIKIYLTKKGPSNGSGCVSQTSSQTEWIKLYLDKFYVFATLTELMAFYPGFVVDGISANATASIIIKDDVLQNTTLLTSILRGIELQNITEYVEVITAAATQANMSIEKIDTLKEILLTVTLEKLSSNFVSYQTQDWAVLFQKQLVVLLPYFNVADLQLLPTNITCSSYQEILKGFTLNYESLSADTKQDIFNHFIKIYLTKKGPSNGSGCVSQTSSQTEWIKLHLDKFYVFATLTELVAFYPGFVVDGISANATASIIIKDDVLQNTTLLTSILRGIELQNITEYVEVITSAATQANMSIEKIDKVKEILLTVTLEKLSSNFVSYQTQDWAVLFQKQLVVLLPYFNIADLQLLPTNITCSSYQEILKGFTLNYESLSADTKQDIFNHFIKIYLTKKGPSNGPGCVSQTSSQTEWIKLYLDKFYVFATLTELVAFYPGFVVDGISANATASIIIKDDVLQNTTLLTSILRGIELQNITEYVEVITSAATQANMSIEKIDTVKEILLTVTLEKLSSNFVSYQTQDWAVLFQKQLVVLLPYFNIADLQLLPTNITCSSYQEILKGFTLNYESLSAETKQDIFNHFIKIYLTKKGPSNGSGCVSQTSSQTEWIKLYLDKFYVFATLTELVAFYPGFVVDGISANATASIIIKDDVLQNTTLLTSILRGIELQNITEYVEVITSAATQANMSIEKIDTLKEILLTVTLEKLSSNFVSYQTQDWAVLFQKQLVVLLPYLNVADLQLLPTNITCSSYQEILKGFTLNYESLSADTKQDIFNHFIKIYLTKKGPSNGSGCVSQTSSQTEWIKLYLDKFYVFATLTELVAFYPGFVVDGISANATASIIIKDDVLQNTTLLTSILRGIELQNITEYVEVITSAATQANMSIEKIDTLKEILLTVTLEKLSSNFVSYQTQDWAVLFQKQLVVLLPYFNVADLQLLPTNITCSSYQEIVKGFTLNYESLSADTKQDIFNHFIKIYLTKKGPSNGSGCVSQTSSQTEWIKLYLDKFYVFATLTELVAFYPGFVVDGISANATASIIIKDDVLQNTTLLTSILRGIELQNITEYVEVITSAATQANMSIEKIDTVKEILLTVTLEKLSSNFVSYQTQDWAVLFQKQLVVLLPYFNIADLQLLPTNITCSSYQEILKGFTLNYESLSADTKQDIFNHFIKIYLTKKGPSNGPGCVSQTSSQTEWIKLYLDKFYVFATLTELVAFYPGFVVDGISANATASIIIKDDVLQNTTLLTSILRGIELQNITEYVEVITSAATQVNMSIEKIDTVKEILLTVTLEKLSSNFVSYQTQDWAVLFQKQLVVLLPYFNIADLQLLPTNITCSSYQEILKGFTLNYESLSADTKQDIFNHFIKIYLTKKGSSNGSGCVSQTSSQTEWIKLYLDKFYVFATLTELVAFYPGFVVDGISANATASIIIKDDVLQNTTLLTSILRGIELQNITEYVEVITSAATQANMSIEKIDTLKEILLTVTLEKLSSNFVSYQTQDWAVLFQKQLVVLLPYFNVADLQLLPTNITCSSYQEILKGFTLNYESLSADTKQDIFNHFIKIYLTKKGPSNGSGCVSQTSSQTEWIKLYLDKFYVFATLTELVAFYPGFVVDGISANATASIIIKDDVLQNTTLLTSILRGIELQNITEYVEVITSAATQANMSIEKIDTVKEILLTVTLEKLSSNFVSYQTQDWAVLFQKQLVVLLPYFNVADLQLLPTNITCSSYQEILKGFTLNYESLSADTKQDIFNHFIKIYLTKKGPSNGSGCVSQTSSQTEWIKLYLDKFYVFATLTELVAFYPGFVVDGISANATASIIIKDDVLQNTTLLTSILRGIELQNITEYVEVITSAATQANMSIEKIDTVKEILLTVTLEKLSSNFVSYQTQDWAVLFQKQLVVLLPYFNIADLQLLPTNITCSSYQEILKGFTLNYESLSADTKQDIFNHFIKIYLTKKGPSNGSGCVSQTSSQTEWIKLYLDKFYVFTTLTELVAFYPGFVVDGISANATASIIIKDDVLQNTTLLTSILRGIELQNITAYVEVITSAATQANMSIEKIDTVKEILLTVTLEKLSSNFVSYQTQDWAVLFQKQLVVLLPYFNVADLQLLPTNITCSSYQEIVKGFTLNYESLSADTKQDIFNHFIKIYLTKKGPSNGSGCVSQTSSQTEWIKLYLDKFYVFATLTELVAFYPGFVVDGISANATASIIIKDDVLQNTTLLTSILRGIELQNITEYVEVITSAAIQANISLEKIATVKEILLTVTLQKLNSTFVSYETQNWTVLFQKQLVDLLPYFHKTHLQLLPTNITCSSYQEIVKGFSSVYEDISTDRKEDIFNYFVKIYLNKQASSNDSTLTCGNNESLQRFIEQYLMSFSAIVDSEKLVSLIPSGQLSQKLNTLAPNELLRYLKADTNSTRWGIILSHYTEISNLAVLMDIFKTVNMSSATRKAVFMAVWPTFLNSLKSLNASDLDTWLNGRFTDYIYLISKELLNVEEVLNASCSFYRNLVKVLSIHYWKYNTSTQQDIYNVFKMYLLYSSTKPRCYVSSDEGVTSWIFTYLSDYLTYSTPEDLRLFTNNVTLLQDFSVDSTCLTLIERLNLSEELKIFFSELIASKDPSISLTRVPKNLLCYIIGKLNIGSVSESQALETANILKNCSGSNVTLSNNVVASLVSSVNTFTAETLGMLGSLAGKLTPTAIIQKTTGSTLQQNLQSLSKIETWSVAQASTVVKKITEVGFTVNATSLESLGSLVVGLEPYAMDSLTSSDVLSLATNKIFVSRMEQATKTVRQRFVQQVIQTAVTSEKNIFQVVPPNLASEIPVSRLITTISNVQEIGQMKWTTSQAQVIFQKVINNFTDYSNLSVNILQGFTCGATNDFNDNQFLSLIKSMKNVALESSQLSCAAKRLAKTNFSSDFKSYPSDVLLFVGSISSNCMDYFSLVGKSNIDLLPRTSPIRTSLLPRAKTCLSVSSSLTKDNLVALGFLACDLTASDIISADRYILTALQSCSSFTDSQKTAINSKIIDIYKAPDTWTFSTMTEIGNLASVLNFTNLQLLPMALQIQFFPSFLSSIKIKYKTSFSYIMVQLKAASQSRTRAQTSCTDLKTEMIINQIDFIVVSYPSSALEACLNSSVMVDNLDTLGSLAFDDSQLLVLKRKLDAEFANGIPEDYLIQLGNIARVYSAEEIAKWNITRLQTLSSLIEKGSWQSNDTKVSALVSRYLEQPGASLDGSTLTILAPQVCSLSGNIIGRISSDAIRNSTVPMDTSTCSQTKKNLLFDKVKSTYQLFAGSKNAYYLLLQPAIGGARAADLIQLSLDSPNMDINVFAGLNPDEVKKLNASTIKDLLGPNVVDLSSIASSDVIKSWVAMNTQSDVNLLGLNLQAGVREPTPNGFIVLDLPTQTSGAAPCSIFSVLLVGTMASIIHTISLFL